MALSNYLLRAASRIVPLAAVFARRPRYNYQSSVNHRSFLSSFRLRSSLAASRYFSSLPTANEAFIQPVADKDEEEFVQASDEALIQPIADKDEEESVPPSDEELIKSLNDEILFEESENMRCFLSRKPNYFECGGWSKNEHDDIVEVPPNFPFQFEDNCGQQTVILSKVYYNEVIIVQAQMPTSVAGEASPSQLQIPMVVRVSNRNSSGRYLEFLLTTEVDKIKIDSMAFKNLDGAKDPAYEGPEFCELDENVQKGFYKYLENRGIKPSTTNYLHEYMLNEDCREYYMWLKNVKIFVDK